MVKYLLFLTLAVNILSATSIEKEVENIIGKGSYASKKGLISVLFKNRGDFLIGSRVNIHKVVKTLKDNNLLDLQFQKRARFQLSFATTDKHPLLFVKVVKEVLNAIGYNDTLTTRAVRDESGFLWKVTLHSAAVVDPLLLSKELKARGAYLTGIRRYAKDNWRYNIDITRVTLKTVFVPLNQTTSLKKPLKPYWINVTGARTISISSKRGNRWHPYIVFYDDDLKILDNYTKERKSYNVSLKIPRHTKYVKISDLYTLENIKRGLKVQISK